MRRRGSGAQVEGGFRVEMSLGKGAKALLLLAAGVVVCAGIQFAAPVLVPLLLAGFIATVTSPLVFWLHARNVPVGLTVLLAILIDVAVLVAFGALIGNSVNQFYERLPSYQERLGVLALEFGNLGAQMGLEFESSGAPGAMMGMLASGLRSIAAVLSNIVLVLLIVAFMLLEVTGFKEKLGLLVEDPASLERVQRASREVNTYLVVKTASSVVTGLLVGIWTAIWGVDLPVLWGLIAFFLNYIPTLGSIIASIPPIVLALIQFGPGSALVIASGYLTVNMTIGSVIEPRVLGRALGLSPLVVFLSMVFWGWLLGPIGALLSVPLTMIIKIVMANSEDFRWVAVLLAPARVAVAMSDELDQEQAAAQADTTARISARETSAVDESSSLPAGAQEHNSPAE